MLGPKYPLPFVKPTGQLSKVEPCGGCSFSRSQNWLGTARPVWELIYELTLASVALLTAYALYNCGYSTEAQWMWLGVIFINASLVWFETCKYAYQVQTLPKTKSLVFYLYGFPLILFTILLLYTAVCLVGRQ